MSHTLEESRSASGSDTESSVNDIDNSYESNDNDTDSLHYDEDEEGELHGFTMDPSDRLIGGSIILRIDPTDPRFEQHVRRNVDDSSHPDSFESHVRFTAGNDNSSRITGTTTGFLTTLPPAEHSVSVATSVSETASENTSTRAVMGDTPVTTASNAVVAEDDIDNSSQASLADSDAERVRRIHNTIFSSLEHDLAELVRIREATIQFLESGTRPSELVNDSGAGESNGNNLQSGDDANEEGSNVPNPDPDQSESEQEPVLLRERLTFQSLPYRHVTSACNRYMNESGESCKDPNTITMNGRSYTPIAKFDDAPIAKPAKPYLEVGLANCEEKAVAARKVFEKLQYGNPEDETACFMRRFWRETSTVTETVQENQVPITIDAASLAQRTASLQASLEEAFGGLRLRLQQVQSNHNARIFESQESQTDRDEEGGGEGESEIQSSSNVPESSQNEQEASAYFQNWDEETSILNNPLNYDIWNELEQENHSRTSIASRRVTDPNLRGIINRYHTRRANIFAQSEPSHPGTTTVGVGTDEGNLEGVEEDDDDNQDDSIPNHCRATQNPITTPRIRRRSLSPGTREFLEEIGLSEEIGRDILNLYTSITERNSRNSSNQDNPEPLFREQDDNGNLNEGLDSDSNDDDENISHIPLASTEECPLFTPNPNDDCSTRVYLDLESELNLPNLQDEGTQP